MRFVETRVFTSAIGKHLDDEGYRHLQIALMLRPEQGRVVPGSGGLRKLRWTTPGSGKRGGLGVIYFWAVTGAWHGRSSGESRGIQRVANQRAAGGSNSPRHDPAISHD
jgi:hypothetical protein